LLLTVPAWSAGDLPLGAKVYQYRCSLCHGNQGAGDGLLPLSVKGYPPTNLLKPDRARDEAGVRRAVVEGGSKGAMSDEMPPWGDELTCDELEAVVKFVQYLRSNTAAAIAMLKHQPPQQEPSLKLGRVVFATRCTLCHGKNGEGDGKMARVIKDPPPFNLTRSGVPKDYVNKIVSQGGAALGRSARMPAWESELTRVEIDSVVWFVMGLRPAP
jgi:cytochrome c oxidase cbb3-type subunit 3